MAEFIHGFLVFWYEIPGILGVACAFALCILAVLMVLAVVLLLWEHIAGRRDRDQ